MKPEINLKLTMEQAKNLSDILRNTSDEGPVIDQGWASPKLEELRDIIDKTIKDIRKQ